MISPPALGPPARQALPTASTEATRPAPAAQRKPEPPPLSEGQFVPMPSTVTFGEFLSALNPLHHIPGVSWVYRKLTGETIQPVFRVLGGLVTGGPIGAIAAAVGALVEELFSRRDSSTEPTRAVAAARAEPGAESPLEARRLAERTTTAGTPLQPLPVAARLAARAYAAPTLPPREAAPPPDPASGTVAAAAALPAPARAAKAEAEERQPGEPAAAHPGRIRRAPVIPVTSGGQDPAFIQRMMQGLEAYERAMRARTPPAPAPQP